MKSVVMPYLLVQKPQEVGEDHQKGQASYSHAIVDAVVVVPRALIVDILDLAELGLINLRLTLRS